ncbi:hypothetical protein PINS_up011921 [Pythium insidiosum]|nr:hypothetical protein PINS_up011921 [Pythium insidiosum]
MIHALTDDHTELDACLGWTVDLLDSELYAFDTHVYTKSDAATDENDIKEEEGDDDEVLSSESDESKETHSSSSSNVSCSESEDDSVSQSPRSIDEIDQPAFPLSNSMSKQAAPATRVRRKRKRMSVEERRIRHREAQRQFMKRKRARINALRQVIRGLERQAQLVQVMRDCEALRAENEQLREACAIRATLIAAEAMRPPLSQATSATASMSQGDDAHVHAIWDDLLEVFDDDEHARHDVM